MKLFSILVTAALAVPGLFSCASAAGGSTLEALGGVQSGVVPVPSAPSAPVAKRATMPDIDLFRYFGYAKTPRSMELYEKGIPKEAVFSIGLESIKNAYLRPDLAFTTGAGTKVHVGGTKASNCPDGGDSCADKEKFFLVLTTSRGESFFVRAMEILNWSIFMSGSKTVTIDGEKYVVKVYANASTPEDSKLEVKGPRGMALSSSLKQVGDAVAAKGADVKLGKAYKLAYGNEIVQGPQGGKFTAKMLVLLIPFPVVDAASYYIFPASDIKPDGVAFPAFEKAFGFRLQGGVLDIYRL